MIYLTGANGLIGTRFQQFCKNNFEVKTLTYRDLRKEREDIFIDTHLEPPCLVHLGWSSNTRTSVMAQTELDVLNSDILFQKFHEKNPEGKIIFVSTAGDMHQNQTWVKESSNPCPRTLYGRAKLQVEHELEMGSPCRSVVLRVSNVWGGDIDEHRVNGLVDKLISSLNTDRTTEIYANLKSEVDLIHVDDLVSLILKVIHHDSPKNHQLFLVGGQSLSICDIIGKISERGSLNIKINQKGKEKTTISLDPSKAETLYQWDRGYLL